MRSPCTRQVATLLLSLGLASALPVPATVLVQFSSPPHSYSHTHDALQVSAQTTHAAVHQPRAYELQPLVSDDGHRTFEVAPLLPRGRSLEAAPLLEETQELVEDETQSSAELEALAARFANNAPRFFHEFPHQRALLANIQLRLSQDPPLSDLRLGSIRPGSPFLRA